jgi:hypothetical protein
MKKFLRNLKTVGIAAFAALTGIKANAQHPGWHKEGSNIPRAGLAAKYAPPPKKKLVDPRDDNSIKFSAGVQAAVFATSKVPKVDLITAPVQANINVQLAKLFGKKWLMAQSRTHVSLTGTKREPDSVSSRALATTDLQVGVGISGPTEHGSYTEIYATTGLGLAFVEDKDNTTAKVCPTTGIYASLPLFRLGKLGEMRINGGFVVYGFGKEYRTPARGEIGIVCALD